MSKKKNKRYSSGRNSGIYLTIKVLIAVLLIMIAAVLLVWWAYSYTQKAETYTETEVTETQVETDAAVQETTLPLVAEKSQEVYLDEYLMISDVGPYTGTYMEDGSDEFVSDVLMLVVHNYSDTDVQYAEITLPTENGDALFSISTLPAGEACVLLEKNRMAFTGNEDMGQAKSDNVALFYEPLTCAEDKVKLQILNGAINVTNISGSSIKGDIVIYYKNAAVDLYYGGITYRVRIEGGLKYGEIKQIMASHFSEHGSKIMFVTIG